MSDRQSLSWFRGCLIIFTAFFLGTLLSCRTTPDLTLEEAQQISTAGEQRFTAPPRVGVTDIINDRYLDGFDGDTCLEGPPKPVNIDRVIERIKAECKNRGYAWEIQYCLPDKLFKEGRQAMNSGQYLEAITLIKTAIKEDTGEGAQRYRPHLAASYAAIGDFSAARWKMGGGNANRYRSSSGRYQVLAYYQVGMATLEKSRGNYRAAEKHYRKAQKYCKDGYAITGHLLFEDTLTQFSPDFGEVLFMLGRPVEAELLLRKSLRRSGWGTRSTHRFRSLATLGRLYYQQGRYADAEMMNKAAIGGYHLNGFSCTQVDLNIAYQYLAQALLAQDRPTEALEQFEIIKRNMRYNQRIFNIRFANDPDWAYALLAVGNYNRAETMLQGALKSARGLYGDDHHQTAEIRGLLAVAQYRQSKNSASGRNFEKALPLLLHHSRAADAQTGVRVAFNRRLAGIVEAYMAFIADSQGNGETAAVRTFPLADAIRGQSVQQAVMASSMRVAAKDQRLSDLVRREQDAGKMVTALNAVLLNSRSQSDGGAKRADALAEEIVKLQQAREVILDEIEKGFPAYAELTRPRPKQLPEIKASLRPNEALLAFYIGSENAFVWSISAAGPPAFTMLPLSAADIEKKVQAVRQSLVPNGSKLSDLPRFDIGAALQLYRGLLEPVAAAWKDARHLIIVPHGALGHLPFSLLVTPKQIYKSIPKVPLDRYRKVPWLIREHSITVLPSSGSLLTLRQLPDPDPNRRAYAGFGDPVFNQNQAALLAAEPSHTNGIATRAIRITDQASLDASQLTSATLEMLQPLPDTREEVLSIAKTLKADVGQDVFLDKAATETAVKQLDLSNRRVLVFATHGLVPGDLDGLHQPALALTSPQVTRDEKNDGLLTMGEIMGLRLNADWVVLSACNTASGQGAGSEAVSGLGQAFFYAGTRALLVSNWPVESVSARLLTTTLFAQQEADPTLSRAEALQKSMLQLIDEGVRKDSDTGKAAFAYAHPVFWAPFSLVGEGGDRK